MFDVGFLEILVIGIVALIVIGPEKLPAVARTVGTWVGKAQRFVRGVKSDFANELQSGDLKKIIGDQNDQISELRSLVTNARKELKAGVDEASAATKTSMDDFKAMVEEKPSASPSTSKETLSKESSSTSTESSKTSGVSSTDESSKKSD